MKIIFLLLGVCLSVVWGYAGVLYGPDVLGCGYECRTFGMPADGHEVRPVCTLVRYRPGIPAGKAFLYVHGYNDYFFQKDLADSITAHSYVFYAIDLRDYGRSIRPGREPFYTDDLRSYHVDLDSVLQAIKSEGHDTVVMMGHSTGGLIVADYLSERGSLAGVSALILNSPFLDWNFGWFMEKLAIPVVSFLGRFFPRMKIQGKGVDTYEESLLYGKKGEWKFNTAWKMLGGYPKRAGWLRAVRQAQKRVRCGKVECPVLLMASSCSLKVTEAWNDAFMHADIVLSVQDIFHYGPCLGSSVTPCVVKGGMHDLFLSPQPVRGEAYRQLFTYLRQLTG